jgi:hypothetical protein
VVDLASSVSQTASHNHTADYPKAFEDGHANGLRYAREVFGEVVAVSRK